MPTRQGIRTVDQIQREHVRELREQLQRDGRRPRHRFDCKVRTERTLLTPASLHGYHRVLRAFYRWCVSEGYSPDRGIALLPSPREPVREVRVFATAEIDGMLRLASSRDRLILEVLLGTGLRVSGLELRDFRLDHPNGPYLDVRAGKGDKQRAVPLTAVLARKLRRYVTQERPPTSCAALFVTERSGFGQDDRQVLRPSAVQLLIRRLGQRAGIKPGRVSPHTFRHISLRRRSRVGWIFSDFNGSWDTPPSAWFLVTSTSESPSSSADGTASSTQQPEDRKESRRIPRRVFQAKSVIRPPPDEVAARFPDQYKGAMLVAIDLGIKSDWRRDSSGRRPRRLRR